MYTNDTETLSHRALQNRLGISFPRGRPPEGWTSVDTAPPEPTLDELKQRKRNEINGARQQAVDAGFVHGTIPVQTRAQDRENLQGLVTAAQLDPESTFTFRDGDNVDHTLTASEVLAMGVASMQHVQAQYQHSWALKDQIEAATTADELDAIQWSAPA